MENNTIGVPIVPHAQGVTGATWQIMFVYILVRIIPHLLFNPPPPPLTTFQILLLANMPLVHRDRY